MMSLLALLLLSVGTADIVRQLAPASVPPVVAGLTGALVAASLGAGGLGLSARQWWIVPAVMTVVAAWTVIPELEHPRAKSGGLAVLVAAVAVVLAFGQHFDTHTGPLHRWYDELDISALEGVGIDRFLLAAACMVFLLSTANTIVRHVLADSGPHVLETENTLKGGRILGPLERWFIFALALAGQLGAIAAIVAAKGIVRFPEISKPDSTGNKAEYVLVGSFVSWFLALLFVPLIK